jgi:iron complex outermembrane recepter protein
MRLRWNVVRMVMVGCFVSLAGVAYAQEPGSLQVTVVATDTGQPVPDARVQLEGTGRTGNSNATGTLELRAVPVGRYTLVVERDGFETVRAEVMVAAGAATSVDVRLPFALGLSESVSVSGRTVGALGLAEVPTGAGRLGLPALAIPAAIDVLDSSVMEARGYQKVSDAVSRMAGVVAGEHPTVPSSFTMRGFTASQVSILRDGLWLGPSTMVMRPQNTFNLDRVELLRGPSSVVNGQGAVAGTVNAVTKSAQPTTAHGGQALLSYGRFNTYHAAAGATGPVARTLWYRVDVSRSGTDGWVDRMDSGSTNVTGSLLWRPSMRARIRVSADVLDDDLPQYFGTPLMPAQFAVNPMDVIRTTTGETIDERTRFINYNVDDGVAQARQTLLRSDISLDLTDQITLSNVAYGFDARREWQNAEGYVFCASVVDVCTTVGQVQRYYGYFIINHDQRLYGDRATLNINTPIAGRDHKAVVGVEASSLDFERARGFRRQVPLAPGDGVDLLNPVPGQYGPVELRGISPTAITSWGLFAEDSIAVTDRIRLAGGLRYDGLDLDRKNLSPTRVPESGGFARQFNWWSWRAGAVVTLTQGVVAYGQFSNAKDPVSSNIFLVNANQNFDLTKAVQWEGGLKADLDAGRTQLTLAYFDITRDDVLDRFALDSATNIGGISSRGVELAGTVQVTNQARLGANFALTDAEYRPSANFVRFAGNRPPNVPRTTANAWASYQDIAGLPIEVGGSARFVGDRFGSNANAVTLRRYTLLDAYAAWTRGRLRATARIDNLTNTAYASWADPFYLSQTDPSFLYANQIMLGAPRTFGVQVQVGF